MPIRLVSTGLSSVLALETYPVVLAAIFAIVFLKQWSAGLDLLGRLDRKASDPEASPNVDDNDRKGESLIKKRQFKTKDLHGNVILVVGGFTSQGLLVCAQLSSLGAQLILLTPTIRSSRIVQMIHLLRDGTSNPLIYAEECDITSLASVEAFAEKWNQGQGNSDEMGGLGAGPAGDISASTGIGGTAGRGSGDQTSSSPRRVDSIIFMPLSSTHYSIGDPIQKTAEGLEYSYAEIIGRVHLLDRILPTLMLSPPYRDIRIISLISPWYAAGLALFDNEKSSDLEEVAFPSRSPWTIEGARSLLWLSLSRELQRRIQVMTDADTRPRSKLPGIDDQGKISTSKITNVNIINVCAGFERGRNVVDYLLPSSSKGIDQTDEWGEEAAVAEDKASDPSNTSEAEELRRLVNLGSRKANTTIESSQRIRQELGQLPPFTWWRIPMRIIQYSIVVSLWPFAWLLCKSPKRTAETMTWATVVPIFDGSQSSHLEEVGLFAVPGEMHREGRLIRPILPESLMPGPASTQLWKSQVDRIAVVLKKTKAPHL